jgi:hypothetical protein
MHPRPVFAFKPDFKPHSRSPLFLHHFLCFKAWLASNWSQELMYNVYSINRMLWYRVWPTRFLTWFASSWSHQFKAYEIQSSPSNNLLWPWRRCLKCQFDQLWLGLLDFIFWSEISLQFSPKPLNHFISSLSHCVLLTVLFPTVYNMWVFIARDHRLHFRFWDSGDSRYCSSGTVATWKFSNLAPLHFDF